MAQKIDIKCWLICHFQNKKLPLQVQKHSIHKTVVTYLFTKYYFEIVRVYENHWNSYAESLQPATTSKKCLACTVHNTLQSMDMRYRTGSIHDLARWRMMCSLEQENTTTDENGSSSWKMLIINGGGVLSRCNEILSCCGTVQNKQSHPYAACTIL